MDPSESDVVQQQREIIVATKAREMATCGNWPRLILIDVNQEIKKAAVCGR
ncbi:MAG: hypothetical protein ACYCQJ_13810 [Nitrososphaerales archaeon]